MPRVQQPTAEQLARHEINLKAMFAPEISIPKGVSTLVWDRKREKEHAKMMKLADAALRRMNKPAPMTDQERRERRRRQQADRRATKALLTFIL